MARRVEVLTVLHVLAVLPMWASAASILGFFPFPGPSHHRLFGPLMEALAARGHSVLYVTPIPWQSSQPGLQHLIVNDYGPQVLGTIDFIELGEMTIARHSQEVYNQVYELLERVLEEEGVQKLIHSDNKFDAVILESYFFQEANSALIHKFGAVGVEFVPLADSAWVGELSGLPYSYSYMMDYKSSLTDRLSLPEKLYNMYVINSAVLTSYFNLARMQKLMDRYYNYSGWESRPPLARLVSNRSIILVNKDPLLSYPFPTAPHVKEVAGISVLPVKPLPQALKTYLDEAEHGVIYMSLGLNLEAATVLQGLFQTFVNVFRPLKQRVLMKWEGAYEGILPPNIMVMRKFPQQDILAHKNCILFITHGGFMSLTETVYHGVPIVGIPFYGDQPKNIIWAQDVGVGIHLSLKNLSETSINWAIGEVLNDKRYRQRMEHRSKMFKDRRNSPLQDAVYWIEHAIKYPNALTPASAYLSFFQLHMYDIICALSAVAFVVMYCIYATISLVHRSKGNLNKQKVQ